MTGDERDGFGDGASSDERDPMPEVQPQASTPDGEPGDLDVDREFARIVAAWSAEAQTAGHVGPWPASEDLDDPAPPRGRRVLREPREREAPQDDRAQAPDAPADESPDAPADRPAPSGDGWEQAGTWDAPPARPVWRGPTGSFDDDPGPVARPTEEDERYVPPDPPPLGGDLLARISWAAVLGGPLFLVLAVIFWRDLPRMLLLAALAAFVGGFVALVARMPRERGEDDDDGAVV